MNRLPALLVLIAALAFSASPLIFDSFAGYPPEAFPVPQGDPPIQPAGWAFAIWGLIYAWLIAGSVFGAWQAAGDPDWQPMRPPLLISLALGVFWLPVAVRAPLAATAMILLMLAFALAALLAAGRRDPLWQRGPVALYAGWLTAASGVSVGVVLGGYGILGPTAAAILSLVAIALIALLVQARRPDAPTYAAGVIWALFEIMMDNSLAGNWPVLLVALGAGAALVARSVRAARQG